MSQTITVSEKAIIGRINRVLAKKSLRLKKTRLRSLSLDTLKQSLYMHPQHA